MRLPRFLLSVRVLMLAVLLSGLILGLIAYQIDMDRRRAEYWRLADMRVQTSRQFAWTRVVIEKALHEAQDASPGPTIGFDGSPPVREEQRSDGDERGWSFLAGLTHRGRNRSGTLIDIYIHQESINTQLQPILVEDRGGAQNSPIIQQLIQLYREHGWNYRVVTGKPSSKSTAR